MTDFQRLGQFIVNSMRFNNVEFDLFNISNKDLLEIIKNYNTYLISLRLCPDCQYKLRPDLTTNWYCDKCGWAPHD